MALLSMSMDIADSTKMKREIEEFCIQDREHIKEVYKKLVDRVCQMESRLYLLLVSGGLDLEKLFVLKVIGDEIWLCYDLNEMETGTKEYNSLVVTFFDALMGLCNYQENLSVPERKKTAVVFQKPKNYLVSVS